MSVAATGVEMRRRTLATAAFLALASVACGEYTGATRPEYGYIRVTVESTGGDSDMNGYLIFIDADRSTVIGISAFAQTFWVPTGTHGVTLADVAAHCKVQGELTHTVSVELGAVAEVKFRVACEPPDIPYYTRSGHGMSAPYRPAVGDPR